MTFVACILENSFTAGAAAVAVLMAGVWLAGLLLKDMSIIDMFWGGGFALVALVGLLVADNLTPLGIATALMVMLWGTRLYLHLRIRWRKEGEEDYRYQKMRAFHGKHWWWRSIFIVFMFQGVMMYLVATPLMTALYIGGPAALPSLTIIGLAIAFAGFLMETLADIQLTRFRATAKEDEILTSGWWARTRHPNYFGDALFWWGIFFAVAAATPEAIWTGFAPVLMNFLLVRVSGAAMLERRLIKKPGYKEYMQRTNRFVPKIF